MFGKIKDSELGMRLGYLKIAIVNPFFWLPHTYISSYAFFPHKLNNFTLNEQTIMPHSACQLHYPMPSSKTKPKLFFMTCKAKN